MSGGLFNHVEYGNCAEDFVQHNKLHDLRAAVEAIEEIAPGSLAAKDARGLLEAFEQLCAAADVIGGSMAKLKDVIQAVDYAQCGDWSEEDAQDAIAAYDSTQSIPSKV